MGADGGTIPKRCELVKNKKKKEKIDRNIVAAVKWRTCQSSQDTLKKPIVACKLGRLYNKEAILEAKLNKTLSLNELTKHIKSLTDVKELRLTENKSHKGDEPENGDTYVDHNETPYICPMTSLGMNGINVFIVNWLCGCVVSEKAIKEVPSEMCHGCGGPFNIEKTIQLYPSEDLLKVYQEQIVRERALKKIKTIAIEAGPSSVNTSSSAQEMINKNKKANKAVPQKVELGQKRKAVESIQNDPKVSAALKSIFTTSEAAKRQTKAHWVTHNPLFY